jgi:site-specific DNA-methyltransferase (adenine-specific)
MVTSTWKNKLYYGDNLDILREHVASESVDLIYLDPPFNSNATYNVLFREKSGERSAAQITAFEDTWHWGMESEYAYQEVVKESPQKLASLLQAMRAFLGQNDMMAYLVMMAQRMVELHRVLKPTGSTYLHCDSTASHYLKLLMDAVFGPTNFRNEIIWKRTSAHSDAKRFGQVTDTILCYSKTSERIWNPVQIQQDEAYESSFYRFEDERGRYRLHEIIRTASMGPRPNLVYEYKGHTPPWGWRMERPKLEALDAEGRLVWSKTGRPYRKTYLLAGRSPTNLWTDIGNVAAQAKERLGYPTQKPASLLERILQSSSNEGDLVLDPFCGCGTTIAVAERLKRRWIGIDITHLAISLMRHRLHDTFGPDLSPYEVIGDPKDLESARALAEQNRYQFEWWALGLVDARPAQDKRKGADRGVDGYINFFDDNSGKAKTVVVQVKSGHVTVSHVRDLKGVLEREKASIGVLITLEEPTRPMRGEATAAGLYAPEHFPGLQFPRLQILTIRELLDGREAQYPRLAPTATFKKAERRRKATQQDQKRLL